MDDVCEESIYQKCGEIFCNNNKTLLFQCVICEENYSEIVEFLIHISKVHSILELTGNCKSVGALENTLSKDVEDSRKLPGSSDCMVCEFEQITNESLFHHLRHQNIELYQCGNCFKKFSRSKALSQHIRQCCDKESRVEELMQDLTLFSSAEPLKCQACDLLFLSTYSLKTHFMRRHTETRHFNCSLCKSAFHWSSSLTEHIRKEHYELELLQRRNESSNEGVPELKDKDEVRDADIGKNFLTCGTNDGVLELCPTLNATCDLEKSLEAFIDVDFTSESNHHKMSPHTTFETQWSEENQITTLKPISGVENDECSTECADKVTSFEVLQEINEDLDPDDGHGKQKLQQRIKTEIMEVRPYFTLRPKRELVKKKVTTKDVALDANCEYCNNNFSTIVALKSHLRQVHKNPKKYKCDSCGKQYLISADLEKHARCHGPKERKHKCGICGQAFLDHSNMKAHELRHSESNKKITCSYCPKKFYTNTEKNVHERFHTRERPFLCQECGRSYISNGEFQSHMRRHRNERKFICDICSKAFFDGSDLSEHKKIHEDKREFKCHLCSEAFNTQKVLTQHIKIHENKREYKCHLCGSAFNQHPGLKSHLKTKHKSIG